MARLLSTWFNGFIGSARATGNFVLNALGKKVPEMAEHYASDFGGYGWKLQEDENGKYILELDSLKIRESLIAHELIIDQIRAICGSLGISQACGKVKEVLSDSTNYYLIMEGEETHGYGGFMANDFIRCQRWTGNGLKGYWVKITSITSKNDCNNNTLVIAKSEFKGVINQDDGTKSDNVSESTSSMSLPSAGDDVVQYGNEKDTARQSAIYIHANGTGQPALDILTGIHSKSFDGCLACRLGGDLPNGGFGLYSKNGRVLSQSESGEVHYTLNPDGTFSLGKGAIEYDGKGTVTIGSNVVIKWGAQSQSKYKWAISSNGTSAPNSGWSSTEPTNVAQGMYIWKKTTYPDGTETTELIGFVGKNGVNGKDGISQHNNLLVNTDFSPKAENYAGTYLRFQSSLATINGTLTESAATGETDMLSASVTGMTDIFRYDVTKLLKSSTWYVIGITMRGSGTATVYCYPNSNESTIYVDGKALGSPSDANNAFALTSSWRRHYIAFQTKADLSGSKYVLVRLSGTTKADIAMVTIGRPYGGGTDLNADGYIQNGLQLIRMATPSEMETFQGINSLCTWRSSQRDFDFYSQNLSSALMAGEWYTLSFYTRGSGKLSTFVYQYGGQVLSGESADMPLADGVKETTFKNDGSHVWDLSSDWVRHIYTFRVREDGNFSVPILLFRATSGTSNQFIAINQVKLEHGKNASDWCLNEMDRKAVSLPDWLKAFNGYTMLGDDYIASGNAFFGKKESDGTYTGCMMSSNSLQIGGNTVVGMYAIDHNTLKVAIDPVGQKYYFKGSVYADEGVFNGTVYADKGVFNGITTGMQLNSVTNIDTSNWSDYLELKTKEITGTTTAKLYKKYAYPKIQDLSSIIYVNSLPETESGTENGNNVTKYYRRWQLPLYGDSDEEIQQALSLVGCKLIIYNNMTDTNEVGKGFQLYGRFFKTGETDFKTYLSLGKGMVVLTMCIGTDGQFYWQYDGAIANLKLNGTLKPGTGWVFERENVSGGLTQ